MCTVSFYRDGHKIVLTSSRDEHINRSSAQPPKKIVAGKEILYYPIDPKSNGTWFVTRIDGTILVLLNGAEIEHISNPPYRKSRGLVLLDLIRAINISDSWNKIVLSGIEPFTVICFANNELKQLRWNGELKSSMILNAEGSYIWSSATLYSPKVRRDRESWFAEFLAKFSLNVQPEQLMSFHLNMKNDDPINGLVINRNETIRTKSITQCIIESNCFVMTHLDLMTNESATIKELIK